MQAGLYIIASNTKAQYKWMEAMNDFGEVVELGDELKLLDIILICTENLQNIRTSSLERFTKAKDYNWEMESKKLLQIWQSLN
jgi:hypothetical protein